MGDGRGVSARTNAQAGGMVEAYVCIPPACMHTMYGCHGGVGGIASATSTKCSVVDDVSVYAGGTANDDRGGSLSLSLSPLVYDPFKNERSSQWDPWITIAMTCHEIATSF